MLMNYLRSPIILFCVSILAFLVYKGVNTEDRKQITRDTIVVGIIIAGCIYVLTTNENTLNNSFRLEGDF